MKGKADQEKLAHPSYVGRPAAPRVFLPRQILHIVLLCVGLVASRASAEPLSLDANTQPQPTPSVKSTGAPVLGEAENATPNAVSLNAEGPSSAAASSILINPKSAKSDQNCLATAAATHDLPLDFFVRLIRQESNFDPNSVSHAGAQGIAQFMPGTARWRGLTDPFEPLQALYESARWLRELREQFGNLGLAAAAYNARPRRVQDWLAGRGGLPGETRAYEFDRRGRADINSVQALLLYNIGDKELTASELRTRGYYLGSNVSYNLKKLVELGFLDHQRSRVDRRSVRIRLTAQGQAIHRLLEALYQKHINTVEQVGGISNEEFATLNKSLHRLERFWTDQILYRL